MFANLVGYLLMLIAMLGNLYLLLAVILGRTLGYYLTRSEYIVKLHEEVVDETQNEEAVMNESFITARPQEINDLIHLQDSSL